jgi:hypothetical protein
MTRTNIEEQAPPPSPSPVSNNGGGEESGTRLVTILYSKSHDLYRVPSIEKPCWLSVMVYPLPAAQLPADSIYLGPSVTADGNYWRKSYAIAWRAIWPGDHATVPADDPMVLDYAAFKGRTELIPSYR